MADLTVIKGNYGFQLAITVKDSAGSAYDLSGYTVTFKMWAEAKPGELLVNAACSIVVAANGTCTYTVVSGDFKRAGVFKGCIELTATGKQESTIPWDIEVVDCG